MTTTTKPVRRETLSSDDLARLRAESYKLRKRGYTKRIHPEYRAWRNMIQRCTNSTISSFKHYGGRGITVSNRWRLSFETFLSDMGQKPGSKYTLDRWPNKDGNYEVGNCRWATWEQQANNRRSSAILEINGVTDTIANWSRTSGVDPRLIWTRIHKLGWTPERAVTQRPTPMARKAKKAMR